MINTLSKIFDCERLFIKNIRDKNDCYIVNDRKLNESSIDNSSNFNFNKEFEERIFGTLGSPIVGSNTNNLTKNYSDGRNTIDAIYSGNVVYLKEKE